MDIVEAIAAHRDELIEMMVRVNPPLEGTSNEDTRQFVVGHLSILSAAAKGDLAVRDEFLATVIPAIRDGGMPLRLVMVGMVRVATVIAGLLDAEHVEWLAEFEGEYTGLLLDHWENR